MATLATTSSAPPTNARASAKPGQRRLFRSLSRFLGKKARPALQHKHASSLDSACAVPPVPALGADEEPTRRLSTDYGGSEPRRNRSRSRSRSTSTGRRGDEHDGTRSESNLSAISGADTDASLYRLPPSTRPPSSIVSGQTAQTHDTGSTSNHSFAPTHASTYKSYASTKPTTLLSVDSAGGANRIAVVPGTGNHFLPHAGPSSSAQAALSTSTSGNSLAAPSPTPGITFSSLSPSTPPSSSSPFQQHHRHRPSTSSTSSSVSTSAPPRSPDSPHAAVGVPSHTLVHPRNNPHPAQPPPDNASVLTLASSSFAPSFTLSSGTGGGGGGGGGSGGGNGRSSWGGGGLGGLKAWSTKQARSLGGSGSGSKGGGGGVVSEAADEDASVRVLPGSRRASDESVGARSTWSAALALAGREGEKSIRSGTGEGEAAGEKGPGARRSSMRTFETGYTTGQDENDEAVLAGGEGKAARDEVDREEDGVERPETAAEGVKKQAEQEELERAEAKGKANVDGEEEEERTERLPNLAPPLPFTLASTTDGETDTAHELTSTEGSTPTYERFNDSPLADSNGGNKAGEREG
ncbi:hypothetical protein JCM1840_003437 [Sporobolomyces johnsonii]